MRVFLTGATGFIGSALIPELLRHGHAVLGYARSDDGADALRKLGAEVHRGDLEDLDVLFAEELALLGEKGPADHVKDLGHGFTTSWRARTASLEKITWSYLRSS